MTACLPADAIAQGLLLALGWISQNLDQFAVTQPQESERALSKGSVARLKPVSELALTLAMLKRCGLRVPFLDSAADWVWRECRQGRELTRLLLARNDFLPACALYVPLHQLGYRCAALDAVLRMLARSDMARALPLAPWSMLAMRYNLWQLGLAPWPCGRALDLYIEARPEPWVVSGKVAYAITHEVFYLTDFGLRPLENPEVDDYLRVWTPYWAERFLADGDDDLSAEFAMVSACLHHDDAADAPAVSTRLLSSVLAHQMPDGSVAGPEGAGSFLHASDDTPARRRFLSRYHTTLVVLMAAALTLRPRIESGTPGAGFAQGGERSGTP